MLSSSTLTAREGDSLVHALLQPLRLQSAKKQEQLHLSTSTDHSPHLSKAQLQHQKLSETISMYLDATELRQVSSPSRLKARITS